MGRKEIRGSKDKMALVAAVCAKFGLGRNDALKCTMDSMRDALLDGKASTLRIVIGQCVIKNCKNPRQSGLAVCKAHRGK